MIGRNGLHRYNNMDLAMLTAFNAIDEFEVKYPSGIKHSVFKKSVDVGA